MALTRLVNDYKDSVRVASTGANINLSAAPNTLDGVSLSLNDRVLVKDQSPSYLNGIYRVTTLGTGANGNWTRSSDFNDWREISPGAMVFVEAGSINGNAFYFINGGGSNVTIDTTAINFSNLFSVNGNITSLPGNLNVAGTLNVTGNIVTKSYETITLTEYANSLTVTGNIDVTNSGNINIGAGGNIYMGSTALPRFRTGNTAPASPNLGDTWYQGNSDILYAYIQDANNYKYWLDISSNPSSYGNLTVANTLTINGNLSASVSSINITGGSSGYVLRTDGNGGLSWIAVTATAGGSNTYVQFNDASSIGGATYLQYNKTSGNLLSTSSTTSTSTTTGAIVAPSIGISGNVNANAFYSNYYLYSNGSTITTPAGGGNTMVQFNDGSNFAGATYLQYNKTSGNLVSNSTTTSTTTTTGAVIIGGGIGIGGNINAAGYIVANGAFNESTTTPGVYIGNLNATARIGFFNGNANANWQIDNSLGTFRWYTPGVTRMSIDYGGNLTLPGSMLITSSAITNSPTTGALTITGGVGVGGAVYANIFNSAAVYAGTIGNTGATHTGSTGTFSGLLTASNLNLSLTTASTVTAVLTRASDVNFQLTAQNGPASNQTGAETARFGVNYSSAGWDSFIQFIRGSSSQNGQLGLWAANTAVANVASTSIYAVSNNTIALGGTSNYFNNIYGVNYYVANALAPVANAVTSFGTSSAMPLNAYGVNYYVANALAPVANAVTSFGTSSAMPLNAYGVNYYVANVLAPVANAVTSFGTSSAMPLNDYAVNYNVANSIIPIANTTASIGSAQRTFQNIYGVSFFGTSTTAKYADLAEMYHADDYYSPGTVLIFGGDLDVTIAKTSHDTRIAGVVSTNPAYLMNDNFESDNWLPVALTGRVPCNVCGPVQKGDLLVSSDKPGVAIKLDKSKYEVGCIIGKSLDIISDTSIRKIEIAVGRY